jgi:septal ring factor EnvC (AmiA/AmiB activator)
MGAAKKQRTSSDAKKQRQQTEQQIRSTKGKIQLTEKQINDRLARINRLDAQVGQTTTRISHLQTRLDSIAAASAALSDSIAAAESELGKLRKSYAAAVKASRRNRRETNAVTFLFSSADFRQAYRRLRYLQEYSKWRERKTEQIQTMMTSLGEQRQRLELMQRQTSSLKSNAEGERRKLRADTDSLNTAVKSLQGEKKQLNVALQKQQQTLHQLDAEIDRLIAQEIEAERRRREAEEAARKKAEAEARKKAEAEAAAAAARKKASGTSTTPAKSTTPSKSTTPAATTTPAKTTTPEAKPTPAPSVQTGGFAAQKGKLPSPLSHTHVVVRRFGVQRHETLSKVEVSNPGVDLETVLGATARAVYPGVVSAIFVQDSYDHVVLVRHGDYITVYANVASLSVKKGDSVKAGTVIGTIGASSNNPQRGRLHFEIRREKEKYDPLLWLKP